MDWLDISSKFGRLKSFIEKEDRFPSASGEQEEEDLVDFLRFVEGQRNKQREDYPNDSHGTICYYLLRTFNNQLDEFETTFSENSEPSEDERKKVKKAIEKSKHSGEDKNSNQSSVVENDKSIDANQSGEESLQNRENMRIDEFFNEMKEKSLSAFSPELNFIEDKDGDYELSQLQIEILQRISLIHEYIKTEENIDKVDRKILEFDILIQKNKFENQISINREDNLCKYWDECVLFERNWKDPLNSKRTSDYYMNFNIKRDPDDVEAYIPGFMLIGFDVDDDFVPNLTIDKNKELFDKVYSFSKYYQRDVVFFVSSKKIYVLRYGSWSDLPIIDEEDTFDDFMDFFNFSVTPVEDAYSDGSEELLQLYVEMETQFGK